MVVSKLPPATVVRAIETARYRIGQLHRRMLPGPAVMMEMMMNAWCAQAITAAADLGIADALAKGPLTAQELAAAIDAEVDTVSRLLRALISRGIFRQRRDGRYDLTPLADTLRSDAEVSLAAMAQFMGLPEHRECWSHLTDAIRTGEAAIPKLHGKAGFDLLADEPLVAEIFNRAMTSMSEFAVASVTAAYDFSRYATIVDVGGGHGRLLAAILVATPQARGILFDLPEVVPGAPAVLAEHHVADRVRVLGGSFFDAVPDGGDVYVLKNVIHDWPDDDPVKILGNVRTAAGAGKHVLLVEFVIPRHGREFLGKWIDLGMLVLAAGRERTADEYGRLLDRAGFRMTRVVETASPFSIVEAIAI
jgi:DNA-binding transcriptional ArsR family regulator